MKLYLQAACKLPVTVLPMQTAANRTGVVQKLEVRVETEVRRFDSMVEGIIKSKLTMPY